MGKPKGKGLKSANNDILDDFSLPSETQFAPRSGSLLTAADGHNVDGWADEDIRTYNELLTERAKLEKEKNELEQKSSRHQTQRALLDENATALDNLFKAQLGGDFKFTGSGICCLDFDGGCEAGAAKNDFPCKHELCTRAKTKGVTWMEMDTIKYYHARVLSEKSQRMQKALRKQRDVELVRVKKDDEEEAALRARRNAILDKATRGNVAPAQANKADKGTVLEASALDMLPLASKDFLLDPKNSAILEAAKENEHIVRRIRGRLDKIRHDVNAGRVSPADARVKLDQANSEMAEAERKNNEFRQMILDAEPALSQLHSPVAPGSVATSNAPASLTTVLQNTLASSNADAFSQALGVMKGFFSASDPHDVQTAITDLRSVLEVNGPMSPVLQKSFKALEEMLAKPNAKGFTVDVTTGDGKTRTCNNVVEVMMNLRLKMQGPNDASAAADPDLNLDEDTIKANLECIKVEESAKKDMHKMAEKLTDDTVENLTTTLKKIKAKAILKSPIPPLSDIVLDDVISDVLFQRSIKALMVEAAGGASVSQLSAKLTSLVLATSRSKPEKYLATLNNAKQCMSKAKKTPPQGLLEAVSKVEVSMAKFVTAHEEKQRKSAATVKTLPSAPPAAPVPATSSVKPMVETKYILEGTLVDNREFQAFKQFFNTPAANDTRKLQARVCEYYHRNLEEGIWDMFHIVLNHQTLGKFCWAEWETEKQFSIENMQLAAAAPEPKLIDTVLHLQDLGVCPGKAAILIAQRITLQIREDFEVAKSNTMVLRSLFSDTEQGNNRDWIRSFSFVAQAMTDLFAMLVFSLVGDDPIDVPIMAADILGFMSTFVLGSMEAAKAEANLRYIEKLVLSTLVEIDPGSSGYKKLQDIFSRFGLMCRDSSRYRCSLDHKCQGRFCLFARKKLGSLVPAPLKVTKKGKESAENPTSSPFDISTGLPRETHLRLMTEAHWDVARSLTPHLKCMQVKKKCLCSRSDQEFAEEIQVLKTSIDIDLGELDAMIRKALTPPKSLWDTLERTTMMLHERPVTWPGNQKRLAELRAKLGSSRFAELFPSESTDTSPTSMRRRISLKQVPVNVPSIQSNNSSNTSEKGNLEKEIAEASSSQRAEATDSDKCRTPPSTKHQPASPVDSEDGESDPWPMTDRELELRDQLLTFTDSVDTMHSFASVTHPGVNQYALDGVAWQIEDMLIGHVEMAYLIAKAQNYTGLRAWMEHYYEQTMPTPLGEHFRVNGAAGAEYGDGPSLPGLNAKQNATSSMALEYISKISEKAKAQSQSQPQSQTKGRKQATTGAPKGANAASTSAVVQQAEKAVADVEQLGRNFIQQMQIVSGRKKRLPKRKR